MKIDVWSDYACPFCYIGKRRLESAMEQLGMQTAPGTETEVVYRSFQLDPKAPAEGTVGIHKVLARKYGIAEEEALRMNESLAEQARGVGLDFHFERVVHTNTYDAHRLGQYAAEQGRGAEMNERLLRAYFTDGLNLGDRGVLVGLAEETGLEAAPVAAILESGAYGDRVEEDIAKAGALGVTGVPFFVFNDKYAISGAQPGPVFLEVLEMVRAEEKEAPSLRIVGSGETREAGGDADCSDGSCRV
ncbi:DsbA family oxidoreductase [Paenibacillus glufosinatiresistens]|uniref:DsbA family oxidoreductase n=1 Tax=Paenibacillus glufosinatiresistens TaxID=3070657 RepID=UPI00286E1575|nr:DsbA family oxidoreductase [Paenibacillus sp. YX.27]